MVSTSDLLTQSQWTSTYNYEDLDLDGVFHEFGDSCEKDDRWLFKLDDKSFVNDAGAVSCDATFPPNSVIAFGQWGLEDNDNTLLLYFPVEIMKFKIISINEHELKMNLVESNNPANVYTQRVVLKR